MHVSQISLLTPVYNLNRPKDKANTFVPQPHLEDLCNRKRLCKFGLVYFRAIFSKWLSRLYPDTSMQVKSDKINHEFFN